MSTFQGHNQVINVQKKMSNGLSKMTKMAVMSPKLRKEYIAPVSYKKKKKRRVLVLMDTFLKMNGNHLHIFIYNFKLKFTLASFSIEI